LPRTPRTWAMPSRGRICRQAAIRVVLRADRGHACRMAGRRGLTALTLSLTVQVSRERFVTAPSGPGVCRSGTRGPPDVAGMEEQLSTFADEDGIEALSPRIRLLIEDLRAEWRALDEVSRLRQEFWVRPATAATKIAPSTQPRMARPAARPANTRRCNRVRPKRSGLSKKSVNSLLISITGNSRATLAPKHQSFPLGAVHAVSCRRRLARTFQWSGVRGQFQRRTTDLYP
jgi:hypothetical protein